MEIQVRLYATLGRYRPAETPGWGAFPWETAAGATPARVAQELGIPPGLLRVCAVNGETVAPTHALAAGDQLALAPAASGGR